MSKLVQQLQLRTVVNLQLQLVQHREMHELVVISIWWRVQGHLLLEVKAAIFLSIVALVLLILEV